MSLYPGRKDPVMGPGQGQGRSRPKYGVWLEEQTDGRMLMKRGKHAGEYLADVASLHERDLRWLLEEASLRPTPAEEMAIREELGELTTVPRVDRSSWANVVIGNRAFAIPPELLRQFDEEMKRLERICTSEQQAFELLIVNSSITPLESLL